MANKYLLIPFFLILILKNSILHADINQQKFILITSLYNETNEERIIEYITCLKKNIAHPLIERIHILYDISKNNQTNNLSKKLSTFDITVTLISGRPSFETCFNIANTLYPNKKIIISNADIYFNETLHQLENYDLNQKILALTRWNQLENNTLIPHFTKSKRPSIFSQDVWIFQSPLYNIDCHDIFLGTSHCDGRIAHETEKGGLTVLNPCMSIQACHLHLSNIRNYTPTPRDDSKTKGSPWCKLDINKKIIFSVCRNNFKKKF